jgi:small conductance mechanosensitive channel
MLLNKLTPFLYEETTQEISQTKSNDIFNYTKEDWANLWLKFREWLTSTGVRILIGLIILFIMIKITNRLARHVRNRMVKHGSDKTVTSVIYQLISIGFKVIWVLLFLSFIGIQTASIGSVIASIGVAIGLAVQGSLSNFAGGLVILVMRPFRVGDFISAQGVDGTVEDIRMFYTHLVTPDNRAVMVPNGALSSGVIVNVSQKDTRRVDQIWSISYDADYDKAVKVLTKIINKNELVLKDKDIFVRMAEHNSSSIDIKTRVWVKSSDYWSVYFTMLEEVKREFDKAGIEIPYQKLDVNLYKQTNNK